METKYSDDKKFVTLAVEDFEKLQASFDKGYGKGVEKGAAGILAKLEPFGITAENIEKMLPELMKKAEALNDPAKIKELLGEKVKDLDVVKDLQQKLQEKDTELKRVVGDFDGFRHSQLVNNEVKKLALSETKDGGRKKAYDPDATAAVFFSKFKVQLDAKGQPVVMNPAGSPIFTPEGKELDLPSAFELFAKSHLYLFEGTGGGSGSSGGTGGAAVNYKDIKHDPKAKSEYIAKHGLDAFQKLVNDHFAKGTDK
jgi:hypothetical protein